MQGEIKRQYKKRVYTIIGVSSERGREPAESSVEEGEKMALNTSAIIKASFVPYNHHEDYIFVSYAHKDSEEVVPILERMNQEGCRIWYDDGIMPGSEWPENVAAHLNECAVVLAFISPESIESSNCRREVTYALSKEKPFLGVILRKTSLTPGMEMQLSAQQCILKYNYAEEEDFYRKLFSSTILSSCRNTKPEVFAPEEKDSEQIPQDEPAVTAAQAEVPSAAEKGPLSHEALPAASQAVKEEPAPQAPRVAAPAGTNKVPSGSLKPRRKIGIAGKILLLFGIILFILAAFSIYRSVQTQQRIKAQEERIRIERAAIPPEVFFGKLLNLDFKAESLDHEPGMSQLSGGISLDLALFPFSAEVSPDNPDRMLLDFRDKFNHSYLFAAKYSLSEGVLRLSAPEGMQLEEGVSPLTDDLQYDISLINSNIRLESGGTSRYYRNAGTTEEMITLQGTANSPGDTYDELASVDFSGKETDACQVFYEDGGYSLLARAAVLNVVYIRIRIEKEMVAYNGYMQEDSCSKAFSFNFINTYPYGFIIKDGNEYYRYQNPVMTLEDQKED